MSNMFAPDPSMAPPDSPDEGASDPDALLGAAIDALTQYVQHAGSDDVDTSTAASCLAKLQTIRANDQKGQEQMAGATPVHKAMAKQIQGLASQAYGG